VLPIYQVDAFTATLFRGNPAAVCLLDDAADPAWMQAIAAEMNLSETAFLYPRKDAFHLRWFTPLAEVALCGHATLASAHILWQTERVRREEPVRFDTLSGRLIVQNDGDWMVMDFPARQPVPLASIPAAGGDTAAAFDASAIAAALGAAPLWVGRNSDDVLMELPSEKAVVAVAPDFRALQRLAVRGFIVTARSGDRRFDFVSRFFAPRVGVPEDPVTGSAHCCLAPYWSQRLGKRDMIARQLSARGGVIRVTMAGDRVRIAGQAVTVMRAVLSAAASAGAMAETAGERASAERETCAMTPGAEPRP
jgi:PhzF family phenazine biosynthesis protein